MSANTAAADATSEYVLERTQREYERLRAQARLWARSTSAVLAAVRLGPGASCLDAGCGPGETMRLMADLVGSTGTVVGLDSDASLVMATEAALKAEGRAQCRVMVGDLAADAAIPKIRPSGLPCRRRASETDDVVTSRHPTWSELVSRPHRADGIRERQQSCQIRSRPSCSCTAHSQSPPAGTASSPPSTPRASPPSQSPTRSAASPATPPTFAMSSLPSTGPSCSWATPTADSSSARHPPATTRSSVSCTPPLSCPSPGTAPSRSLRASPAPRSATPSTPARSRPEAWNW